jgi:PIN domain nuclease of toxin-antitoxin system
MLLLDTCVLLWLAAEQRRLSPRAKQDIGENAGQLFVSSITAFEVAIKARSGKIELPLPSDEWFTEALESHDIHEVPMNAEIAIASVQLPRLHDDPCDRIIIATAHRNAMRIVTCDRLIAQYPEAIVVW